ncbi:hypothetical protein KPL71_022219 [Citrus sinensis]|uniref:Uncharacterized protein n=1 Tax=Citrus sinensis TaxID=2711 RepID=A0ACB8JNK3_CITSI|nr:hypothetical protein KPL71_022219 [Citrus sinensis]
MACQCFRISRGIVIDLYSSFKDFPPDRPCFGVFTPEGGLRIIEVELNLVSEVLHTKDQVADSVRGIMSKFICFGSVVAALSVFYFQVEKHGFNDFDVGVTYTLFLGAMALEIISFFRLFFFFSDRTWSGSVSGPSVIKARPSNSYGIDKFFHITAITTYKEPLTKDLGVKVEEEFSLHTDPEIGIAIPSKPSHDPKEDIRIALRRKFTAEGDCTLTELDTKGDLIKFVKGLPKEYDYKFSFDITLTLYCGTSRLNSFTKTLLRKFQMKRLSMLKKSARFSLITCFNILSCCVCPEIQPDHLRNKRCFQHLKLDSEVRMLSMTFLPSQALENKKPAENSCGFLSSQVLTHGFLFESNKRMIRDEKHEECYDVKG